MSGKATTRRPKRWDNPYGENISEDEIEAALRLPLLAAIDQTNFRGEMTLRNIIRHDSRVVHYRRGDVVVHKGDYGHAVFQIMSGHVRVLMEKDIDIQRQLPPKKLSYLESLAMLWKNPTGIEVRRNYHRTGQTRLQIRQNADNQAQAFVADLDSLVDETSVRLGDGEMFGEIAALTRAPRNATVVAETDATLLEISWQGFREIRQRDLQFRAKIDALYQSRAFEMHLRESPLFAHLDSETLSRIVVDTVFETHGDMEWSRQLKDVRARQDNSDLSHEPIIVEEGHYINSIILVRSGFARVSSRLGEGHRTISCLSKGDVFGLREILDHRAGRGELIYRHSLRALSYVDILRIPVSVFEDLVLTKLTEQALRPMVEQLITAAMLDDDSVDGGNSRLEQTQLEAQVNYRTVNGTAAMAIDLNRCVGCDDCVRACASAHGNNPRFVREGLSHANLMIGSACMHCVDPVCLIGCPTGAIHRSLIGGSVVIEENLCIGCGTCANACPYESIRMVAIRDDQEKVILDADTQAPVLKATKCDLCSSLPGGPACQRACPHDALIRIDMRERDKLAAWLAR